MKAAKAVGSIDVHTHCYLPKYMQMLRSRNQVPKVFVNSLGKDRLVILPEEEDDTSTSVGRPIGSEYFDPLRKIAYMDTHNIDKSLLSLANPWIDFLEGDEAETWGSLLNEEMSDICEKSGGRFLGLGTLPIRNLPACLRAVEQISKSPSMKGIILGTHGLGKGLDDPALLPLYQACEEHGTLIFVHPHYGVGGEHYKGYGHSLHLALGFTFETTVAISRFILSGMFDQCPNLKFLLAHSGGTLPFLAGRLDSCVVHDPAVCEKLKKRPSDYLKMMYYDATCYHPPALKCTIDLVGADRIMFGTDHPFFPPLGVENEKIDTTPWESCNWNYETIETFQEETEFAIKRGNAMRILDLKEENTN